ncbi:MAG: hypothetical protein MUF71_17985 [Candidatus Kapabacteria bacterium]|jgi:hypothetical protein|nr:hypothetical protein [Candidatus Kapabacteria bacterium]
MFIGHYGVAIAAAVMIPDVPALVPLTGVAFPDLLWGGMVLAGKEKVGLKPASPLITDVEFTSYPYSHSLVMTSLIACAPALALVSLLSLKAAVVFLLASISHWLLDVLVHQGDLPVVGFGQKDRKIGFGLWKYPLVSFLLEFATFVLPVLWVMNPLQATPILVFGTVLHAANANGFFGFNPKGAPSSASAFAILVLFGFVLATLGINWLLR